MSCPKTLQLPHQTHRLPQCRAGWGGRASGMGQHWQRGLGREQCRDTQPETRTAAPLHTQTASETPKAGHLNNCWGKGRQPDRETEPPPPALRQHPAHSWCTSRDPCLAICSTCCFNYPWRSRGWQGSWEKEEEEEGAGGKGRGGPGSSLLQPQPWDVEKGAGLAGLNQNILAVVHVGCPRCAPRASPTGCIS